MKVFPIVLFICSLFFVSNSQYNETEANRYITYSEAAYCCGILGHGISAPNQWNCNACKKLPGMQNITVMANSATNANGYIGYNAIGYGYTRPYILVAFSGTDPISVKNWIDDINTVKTDYPYCSGCKVHKGFYETYLSVQGQLQDAIMNLRKMDPDAPVQITGHSLGAALTIHAALDILINLGIQPTPVYSFGTPRVGNDDFADFFNKNINDNWRVIHNKDVVPHLPPEWFGFHHTATEVFYNQNQNSYTVCDGSGEDKHCSDKFVWPWVVEGVLDHLDYLHHDIATNYLSCKL